MQCCRLLRGAICKACAGLGYVSDQSLSGYSATLRDAPSYVACVQMRVCQTSIVAGAFDLGDLQWRDGEAAGYTV